MRKLETRESWIEGLRDGERGARGRGVGRSEREEKDALESESEVLWGRVPF